MNKRPNNLKEGELCTLCNTTDCISLEYSNTFITITGASILGKSSDVYMRCCVGRIQLNNIGNIK